MKKYHVRILAKIFLTIFLAAVVAFYGFAIYTNFRGANIAMDILTESRYEIVEETIETGFNPTISSIKEIE